MKSFHDVWLETVCIIANFILRILVILIRIIKAGLNFYFFEQRSNRTRAGDGNGYDISVHLILCIEI